MPQRKQKTPLKSVRLVIRVDSYEVSADASPNIFLKVGRASDTSRDSLVFEYRTSLEIAGTCISPPKRNGEKFELSVHSDESSFLRLTLKDIQERDEHHSPIFREHRGKREPVYRQIPGIATIARRRETGAWHAWMGIDPRLVTDMLIILGRSAPTYLAIYESMVDRQRWVESLSLRTSDPTSQEE